MTVSDKRKPRFAAPLGLAMFVAVLFCAAAAQVAYVTGAF